jgi:hypothetical protein
MGSKLSKLVFFIIFLSLFITNIGQAELTVTGEKVALKDKINSLLKGRNRRY